MYRNTGFYPVLLKLFFLNILNKKNKNKIINKNRPGIYLSETDHVGVEAGGWGTVTPPGLRVVPSVVILFLEKDTNITLSPSS